MVVRGGVGLEFGSSVLGRPDIYFFDVLENRCKGPPRSCRVLSRTMQTRFQFSSTGKLGVATP